MLSSSKMFSKTVAMLSFALLLAKADRFGPSSQGDRESRNGFANFVDSFDNGKLFETMKISHPSIDSTRPGSTFGSSFEGFHQGNSKSGFNQPHFGGHGSSGESSEGNRNPQLPSLVTLNGQNGGPEYGHVEANKFGHLSAQKLVGSVEHGNREVIRGFQDFQPLGNPSFVDDGRNTNDGGYGNQNPQGGYLNNIEPGMPYQFEYNVNEYGNQFGHAESSDGKQVTGRYFVRLPDGRLQTVDFKSDPYSGYIANVQYEGQPQYPITGAGGDHYLSGTGPNGVGSGVHGGSVGQLPLEDFSGVVLRKRSRPSKAI